MSSIPFIFQKIFHIQYDIYLRPSYFNDTLILAIFVSMDLAHINFSDFTKIIHYLNNS